MLIVFNIYAFVLFAVAVAVAGISNFLLADANGIGPNYLVPAFAATFLISDLGLRAWLGRKYGLRYWLVMPEAGAQFFWVLPGWLLCTVVVITEVW